MVLAVFSLTGFTQTWTDFEDGESMSSVRSKINAGFQWLYEHAADTTKTDFLSAQDSTNIKVIDDMLFSYIEPAENSFSTVIDMEVDNTASDGDAVGYSFNIDGNSILRITGVADGSGGVDSLEVYVEGGIAGINADAKLIRINDITYAMSGTDWRIIDDWDWAYTGHNMIVDTVNHNVECVTGYGGRYMVSGFISLSVDANNQDILVGIGVNGNDPTTHKQANVYTRQGGDISNLSFVDTHDLEAGDYLSLYVKNTNGDENITVGRSNFVFYLLHQD